MDPDERDWREVDIERLTAERDAAQNRCMDLAAELTEWRHEATEEQLAVIKARTGGRDALADVYRERNDAVHMMGSADAEREEWRRKSEALENALEFLRDNGAASGRPGVRGVCLANVAGDWVTMIGIDCTDSREKFFSRLATAIGVDTALLLPATERGANLTGDLEPETVTPNPDGVAE